MSYKMTMWGIVAVLLLVALFIMVLLEFGASTMDGVEWKEATHIVQDGETLWDIAEECCPQGVDLREWIDEVEKINGIGDYIYAGDKITVLIPE